MRWRRHGIFRRGRPLIPKRCRPAFRNRRPPGRPAPWSAQSFGKSRMSGQPRSSIRSVCACRLLPRPDRCGGRRGQRREWRWQHLPSPTECKAIISERLLTQNPVIDAFIRRRQSLEVSPSGYRFRDGPYLVGRDRWSAPPGSCRRQGQPRRSAHTRRQDQPSTRQCGSEMQDRQLFDWITSRSSLDKLPQAIHFVTAFGSIAPRTDARPPNWKGENLGRPGRRLRQAHGGPTRGSRH